MVNKSLTPRKNSYLLIIKELLISHPYGNDGKSLLLERFIESVGYRVKHV